MSNGKWVQFLPIATAFLEEDGTIRLEWEWSSSLDTYAIDRGDSDMTLAEAEQVGERIGDWLNTQPVNVYIAPKPDPTVGDGE